MALGDYEAAISSLLEADKVQYAAEHNRAFAYLTLAYLSQFRAYFRLITLKITLHTTDSIAIF